MVCAMYQQDSSQFTQHEEDAQLIRSQGFKKALI